MRRKRPPSKSFSGRRGSVAIPTLWTYPGREVPKDSQQTFAGATQTFGLF